MTRPTAGALTGAGFSQIGSTSKYTKTTGTALCTVDLATGTDKTGVASVAASTPGTPISEADFNSHAALLASLGVPISDGNGDHGGGCTYYGQTT